MAMEIKAIPTLKGKEAEHFVKAADKAYKNQNQTRLQQTCAWKPRCAQKAKML